MGRFVPATTVIQEGRRKAFSPIASTKGTVPENRNKDCTRSEIVVESNPDPAMF
jgi:hypothetical protein